MSTFNINQISDGTFSGDNFFNGHNLEHILKIDIQKSSPDFLKNLPEINSNFFCLKLS
jgi:hypothetical protein